MSLPHNRRRSVRRATPASHLVAVLTATSLVALPPVAVVWWLRASGTLTQYLPGMAVGIALSLAAAHLGRRFWLRRPASQHLLFSELMIWGYAHRWYRERRLASARALLGQMSQAQVRAPDGLSRERQARLLEGLARRLDARDANTYGHSRRVARNAWIIARRMHLAREEVARVRTAAAIHDVGKIETPTAILRKAGPLTDAEFEVMKSHAADGARIAACLNDDDLQAIIRHHHERLDGSGYPDGLAGDAIPLGARIIAVADTFDAITAERPYRKARTHKDALDILIAEAGSKLDQDVVQAFSRHYSGRRPLTLWTWLTTLPERALSQLASSAGTVASAAKMGVSAALVGGLAAGAATVAHPDIPSGRAPLRLASVAAGPAHTSARPGIDVRAGETTPRTPATRGPTGHHPGRRPAIALPAVAGGHPKAALAAGSQSGLGRDAGATRTAPTGASAATSPNAGSSPTEEPGSNGSSPESRPVAGNSTGTGSSGAHGTTGAVGGAVEAVAHTVEETTSKVESTAKSKVEEVKGKVEAAGNGAVEEVKGKLGGILGKR